jgi:fructokinase
VHHIGIDLGGTKTEGILLDDSLNVIERKRLSTPRNDYKEIIKTISKLVNDLFYTH